MSTNPHIKLPPLYPGTLIRRYKRFLADVQLTDGGVVTAHCSNSGTMLTCCEPGRPVLLSRAASHKRKTAWSWELIKMGRIWVGVNTLLPNRLIEAALRAGMLPEFAGWEFEGREVPAGGHSRIDLLAQQENRLCYIEVKNVTMVHGSTAAFPDAVTGRGAKHLRVLTELARQGHNACMVYVIQRSDGRRLRPADEIDPAYGTALREALKQGVRAVAYRCRATREQVEIIDRIPVDV